MPDTENREPVIIVSLWSLVALRVAILTTCGPISLTLSTLDARRTGFVITMFADVLVPYTHQAISNHHTDSNSTIHGSHFMTRYHVTPLNKQCSREVGNLLVSLLLACSQRYHTASNKRCWHDLYRTMATPLFHCVSHNICTRFVVLCITYRTFMLWVPGEGMRVSVIYPYITCVLVSVASPSLGQSYDSHTASEVIPRIWVQSASINT